MRVISFLFTCIFLALAAWAGGILLYVEQIKSYQNPPEDQKFQSIIVLTGGAERVYTAVDLFLKGRGTYLLVSGVDYPRDLLKGVHRKFGDHEKIECCFFIDKIASTTKENATESAKWIHEHEITDVLLLTSDYHMPRSTLEFKRLIPGIQLTPYIVHNPDLLLDNWWQDPFSRHTIITEYNKFLVILTKYLIQGLFHDIFAFNHL